MFQRILVIFAAVVLVFAFCCNAAAQEPHTLSDCIQIALANSVRIDKAENNVESAVLTKQLAADSYIPSLSISNQNNLSTGRVLDPTTYQFLTNRSVYDMNAVVGGSMTLFSGFERPQNIKKAKLNLQSALLETEKAKNDLVLNVTALFLNIILDKEAIAVCERKIEMLEEQARLIQKKVEYEAATAGDLLNVQADVTDAKVELVSVLNNLDLDKISMCELLAIEDWEQFDVSTEDCDYETIEPHFWNTPDVLASAFTLPQIRQGELAIDIAKRDVAVIKSSFWPTLSLNAGYGSTYSNARTRNNGDAYSFRDQFRDNASSYVTLSLNIPILSAISVSNTVGQKKLACTRAEYDLTQAKLSLDKEVKQAIVNANTAYEKYTLLATDVGKYREALRQTREKYNAGAATYYDYQVAVSNLFQAESQQLQSKYEYIFRTRIIDFYAGNPL